MEPQLFWPSQHQLHCRQYKYIDHPLRLDVLSRGLGSGFLAIGLSPPVTHLKNDLILNALKFLMQASAVYLCIFLDHVLHSAFPKRLQHRHTVY